MCNGIKLIEVEVSHDKPLAFEYIARGNIKLLYFGLADYCRLEVHTIWT
jgi:hypothetical protein